MAKTTRQTSVFGVEDWRRIYETYREADFQSYDYETLRKSFVDYLRRYYPESFNDYVESSEFIALLDVVAFMGQSLSFRSDLNARENFLETAERRDSVTKSADLISYTPKRAESASGFLKVQSISTTETVRDFAGNNLADTVINWNDATNQNWQEQFNAVFNAALVDSQRIGNPSNSKELLGVSTEEYTINLSSGLLPVFPFNATVNGVDMAFEAISATSVNENRIYEPTPRANGQFNVLFRNDGLGFASDNTGYFLYFKQGTLRFQDFRVTEKVPNRQIDIDVRGINDQDVWLNQLDANGEIQREWEQVENIYSSRAQSDSDERYYYSVSSRANDQITLNFGDGVFAEMPLGFFRTILRVNNGLNYVITTEDLQSVTIPVSYVSRNGRNETLTLTVALETPVSNARSRETLDEIKQRAPARYYTQNRMVNGEDYNNFPFTKFGSIIKSKAVNRSSVGTNRYLDLIDITGKYSSTNIFASDGVLYREQGQPSFTFTWNTINDIADTIINRVEPLVARRSTIHFYHDQFARPNIAVQDLEWNLSTTQINQTTGFFYSESVSQPQSVGGFTSSTRRYIEPGALLKFEAPAGFYFTTDNQLAVGTPTRSDEKSFIWASPVEVIEDGTNFGTGNLPDGIGPITLNERIPTGAIVTDIIPKFVIDFPVDFEQQIVEQVRLFRNFGLGYDSNNREWYIITSTNLAEDAEFNLDDAKNTAGINADASWLVQFTTQGQVFTVKSRSLEYYFASVLETRFYYDDNETVFDSKNGTVINDFVNVLKTNSQPDSPQPIAFDNKLDIIGQPQQSDGFVNDFSVLVSYADSDSDGIADDPDFFREIVNPSRAPSQKLVFLQRITDFDNLERLQVVSSGVINSSYSTKDAILQNRQRLVDGQVFYTTAEQQFWQFSDSNGIGTLTERDDFFARTGRQDIDFQYRHNSPNSRRIDPGSTNIIDIYVITSSYYSAYQRYINDSTNTVAEPVPPSIEQLSQEYSELQDFKMISDNIILNSAKFKTLFGSKADVELQATIKVVKQRNSVISDSEVKSRVISEMNNYFTIENWDFGDTFYFSELSAYLHQELGDIVSSVVLVPLDLNKRFGDLYEVRSQPDEIFVNAATVNDVEVVDSLTSSTLRISPTTTQI
jgi:hypothetical protein